MPCGFTPDQVPEGKQWWEKSTETVEQCPRDTWNNHDRCIWHVRQKHKQEDEIQQAINSESSDHIDFAYLEEASLSNVDFKRINFRSGNFAGTNFENAQFGSADYSGSFFEESNLSAKDLYDSRFHNCNFERADLSETELELVEFNESNLRMADLERIKCFQTNFRDANLEGAVLTNSLVTEASFENAKLLDVVFDNAKISEDTFDKVCYYEIKKEWANAASVYRTLMTLSRANSITNLARTFYFRQKQCRRRNYRKNAGIRSVDQLKNTGAWIRAEGSRFTTGYGHRPGRVMFTWGAMIVIWTFGYVQINGVERNGVTVEPKTFAGLMDYLYFSVSTFTPLGSNNLQPTGTWSQIFAMSETLLGAFFIALLVYVLGRRITW